jgi:MFS family permease
VLSTRRAFAVLCAATLAEFTAMGLFLAAIPLYVTGELGGSNRSAGVAVGVFSVSAVVLRPFIGRSMDRRGRKPFLVGALALLAVSSPLLIVARSLVAVAGVRVLQGVVGAAFYTSSAAVATDLSPPHRRASTIARFSLFLYAGFAIGPALGERVIDASGFTATWLVASALAVGGLVAVAGLPETGRLHSGDGSDGEGVGRRRRLLHPAAIGPGLVLMLSAVGYSSVTAFSALYARHVGMADSGALYATFAITIIGVRLASLRTLDRRSHAAVALPGLVLAAAGLGVLAVVQEPAAAFVGVGAFGAGFALVFPSLMAFTVERVSDRERGETLGSFTAFMDVGTGTGGYLVGRVADGWGFGWAYGVPALLCAGGAVLFAVVALRPQRWPVEGRAIARASGGSITAAQPPPPG